MNKVVIAICSVLGAILLACSIWFCATPSGRSVWNTWWHTVKKADDATKYETKKEAEDTCRSMIASYNADRLYYETYKTSDNEEMRNCAYQALARANKTASTYNNFIIKNSYVWNGNVPSDIYMELPYLTPTE